MATAKLLLILKITPLLLLPKTGHIHLFLLLLIGMLNFEMERTSNLHYDLGNLILSDLMLLQVLSPPLIVRNMKNTEHSFEPH